MEFQELHCDSAERPFPDEVDVEVRGTGNMIDPYDLCHAFGEAEDLHAMLYKLDSNSEPIDASCFILAHQVVTPLHRGDDVEKRWWQGFPRKRPRRRGKGLGKGRGRGGRGRGREGDHHHSGSDGLPGDDHPGLPDEAFRNESSAQFWSAAS